MPVIRTEITINAPVERVFDLARSIDAHVETTAHTREKPIAGRTKGLIGYAESVTWEARHLGRKRRLKVQITEFDRPNQFVVEMVAGDFRSMRHVHRFRSLNDNRTEMIDELVFKAPMGPIGTIVEHAFLTRYMRRFIESRNRQLKAIAESDRWKSFIPNAE